VETPWVVVLADDVALGGAADGEGLLRFQKIDAVIGASLVLARGQSIDGLWLDVTEEYGAPMAGRDIATLTSLGALANVVISSGDQGSAVCELIAAMFSDAAITFSNEAGTLVNAFNRPSPVVPPTLWWLDGNSVTSRAGDTRSLSFSDREC
jgi:hypothetical protein